MHDGTTNNDDRIEISGVENINPIGYLSAIGALDQTGGAVTGFIKDCMVTDHLGGSAFGASASRNFKIFNNYARNVAIGVNFDTYPATNLEIFDNRLHHVTVWGVLLNNGSVLKDVRFTTTLSKWRRVLDRSSWRVRFRRLWRFTETGSISRMPSRGLSSVVRRLRGVFRDNVIQTTGEFDTSSVPNLEVIRNRDPGGKPWLPQFRGRDSLAG